MPSSNSMNELSKPEFVVTIVSFTVGVIQPLDHITRKQNLLTTV